LIDAYLELGARRVFAVAAEWPGWARAGRDEPGAVAALLAYRDRYQAAIGSAGGRLPAATDEGDVRVVERLRGGSGTDFGVPGNIPDLDQEPLSGAEMTRQIAIHAACWEAFERSAARATGRTLAAAGPRGGGRAAAQIERHVAEAEAAYVNSIGIRYRGALDDTAALRAAFVEALEERNAGRLAETGPRGGKRWPARYAVRRSCWHLLDHAWEIEDRSG
jgi:hypothetical protein